MRGRVVVVGTWWQVYRKLIGEAGEIEDISSEPVPIER